MQRRRLLAAFSELLEECGVESATVGSISSRAGVSRRTFYELFEDREACYLAAFEGAIERISEVVVPSCMDEPRWGLRVRIFLVALLGYFEMHPGVARMCVVEALKAGPKVLECRERVLEALVKAVDAGRHEVALGSEPPPLVAEGVVGGALAVIHTYLLSRIGSIAGDSRARSDASGQLITLAAPLTGMVLYPYIGAVAARRELERALPKMPSRVAPAPKDPFKDLPIRFTYRTARVMSVIAAGCGSSNREIAEGAGVVDEGQMSRLLARLQRAGLVENRGEGRVKGGSNAWWLTGRGEAIHATLSGIVPIT